MNEQIIALRIIYCT